MQASALTGEIENSFYPPPTLVFIAGSHKSPSDKRVLKRPRGKVSVLAS
jgi:hypothetical protein